MQGGCWAAWQTYKLQDCDTRIQGWCSDSVCGYVWATEALWSKLEKDCNFGEMSKKGHNKDSAAVTMSGLSIPGFPILAGYKWKCIFSEHFAATYSILAPC